MAQCGSCNKCGLKTCTSPLDKDKDDTVEVKTVWSKKKLDTSCFQINWSSNGEASFHKTCWDQISKPKNSKASKRHAKDASLTFSSRENVLLKEAKKTAEYRDSGKKICREAERVADMLKKSNHCVAFTGAGISTSAGIGDYRGKNGKWTEMDQNKIDVDSLFDENDHSSNKRRKLSEQTGDNEETEEDGVSYEELRPTYTHEALYKLMMDGFIKYIISQNGDGLHGLSGIPTDKISELHGNVFLETCEKCDTQYYRPYYVMDDTGSLYYEELEDHGKTDVIKPKFAVKCKTCGLSHRTGRK